MWVKTAGNRPEENSTAKRLTSALGALLAKFSTELNDPAFLSAFSEEIAPLAKVPQGHFVYHIVRVPISLCSQLTDREIEVAQHVANGLANKKIADILNVKEKTIDSHIDRIFRRLGIKSRAALACLSMFLLKQEDAIKSPASLQNPPRPLTK